MKRNNLIIRTAYTFFNSLIKVDDIIDYSINNNLDYASIVDKNIMYGAYELYEKSLKNNLKPIIGLQIETEKNNEIIFAKNYKGYQELMKISSLISLKQDLDIDYSNLIKLEKKLPIISYINEEDSKTFELFTNIGKQKKAFIEGTCMKETSADEKYISSIVEQIDLKIPQSFNVLPKFATPNNEKASSYIQELLKESLEKYTKKYDIVNTQVYIDRMIFEYKIIDKKNFFDYFLIVSDIVKFAKDNGINVGPGRGSAAGSLISFLLGITTVDPIKSELLFERFLNPERISMPDIDIDFQDTRREEVIEYIIQKYGKDKVAQIITYQTLRAKMSIKDVGRALGISVSKQNEITKVLSDFDTLEKSYKQNKRFRNMVDSDDEIKTIFESAKLLEGLPRQFSTHAAGIVISDKPIYLSVPIQATYEGNIQTQYSMAYMEMNGLLKIDILGLRNLSFINETLELIGEDIDIQNLDLKNKKVYKLLSLGKTGGIFQLESNGMTAVLRQMQPESFEDIVATTSLFRPGPQKMISKYIARKKGKENIEYIDPVLEPILKKTNGIIVYQEQIMKIAQEFAGFSLAKADVLRRAIGKKDTALLNSLKTEFENGSKEKGRESSVITSIYNLIYEFAEYGFNRSHAYAYSIISYQLAFLKVTFPLQFMSALLTSAIGSKEKTNTYIEEAQSFGFKILNPSINEAERNYKIIDKKIIMSLTAIKGIGPSAVKEIVEERKKKNFTNFFDFIIRMSGRRFSKTAIELLIKVGSFDEFKYSRITLLENIDTIEKYVELIKIKKNNVIEYDKTLIEEPNIIKSQKTSPDREYEIEVLGFTLKESQLNKFKEQFEKLNVVRIFDIPDIQNSKIRVAGEIKLIKTLITKNGGKMAFVTLEDQSGDISLTFWPTTFSSFEKSLINGKIVLIEGKIDLKRQKTIIVSNMKVIK